MDLKHCPWLPINLILYTHFILHRRSDSRLNEFQDLVKSWQEWDSLTGLANHHTIVEILFGFLKEDSTPDRNGISPTDIHEKLSQDASAILAHIITILSDPETYKQFLASHGSLAQKLLDVVQDMLDSSFAARPVLSKALIRLSRAAELHPRCFPLSGVEKIGEQVAAGAFGDIWQGRVQGQSVVIKMMRAFRDTDIQDALKAFGREALIWRQLSHPNLLPFFGLYYVDSRLCLVSPWMENGHLPHFLRHASTNIDCLSLISDVALGLKYLHTEHIVHGDLKGTNILITPSGRACITDFGLSTIADAVSLQFTHSTGSVQGGTARYQAPEVLSAEMPNHYGSDVYAFACVCYEILTGKPPFFELPKDVVVIGKVMAGNRPSKPEITLCNAAIWLLLQECWQQSPTMRPSIQQVIHQLPDPPIAAKTSQFATDWDDMSTSKFRRRLQDRPLLPSITEIKRQVFGDFSPKHMKEPTSSKKATQKTHPPLHSLPLERSQQSTSTSTSSEVVPTSPSKVQDNPTLSAASTTPTPYSSPTTNSTAPLSPLPAHSPFLRTEPDSTGHSLRKANMSVVVATVGNIPKRVSFRTPPTTQSNLDRTLHEEPGSASPSGTPSKNSMSLLQPAHRKEHIDLVSSDKTIDKSTSAVPFLDLERNGEAGSSEPLRSGTPDSSSSDMLSAESWTEITIDDLPGSSSSPICATKRVADKMGEQCKLLPAQSWGEITIKDLVSNLGSRERRRQEILLKIVSSEDRYFQELVKMKDNFIDPLLHLFDALDPPSVPNLEHNYHCVEAPDNHLPPIAGRFLLSDDSPGSQPHTPTRGMLRKFKKAQTTNDGIFGNAVAPSQLPEDLKICLEAVGSGIFDGHRRLSEALKKRYDDQYPLVRSLADIFVANSSIFHGYTTYVLHLERAFEQVNDALSNVTTKKPKNQDKGEWQKVCKLLQKLEATATEKGETPLSIALSRPFLRLFKYPLLFQNLLLCTDPSTFEYESTLQMVAEVETILQSIEDEKIQQEERDKTRDVFARIEGLDKVRQLALPKPSRVLIEERPYTQGSSGLTPPEPSSPPPVMKSVGGKSFKRLGDVLYSGSVVGGKKDLWLVVFNDVLLQCQRTGTTSLPVVASAYSRTNSLRSNYATAGQRNSLTKPRNLYKFIQTVDRNMGNE